MKKKKEKTGLCLFKPNSLLRFLFFLSLFPFSLAYFLAVQEERPLLFLFAFFFLNVLLFIYVISISVVLKGEA